MGFIFILLGKAIVYYSYALIIYILMSWFPNARETGIGQFLTMICEPYLEPFRKIVPTIGMFDFSPIIAFFVLNLAAQGVYQLAIWF